MFAVVINHDHTPVCCPASLYCIPGELVAIEHENTRREGRVHILCGGRGLRFGTMQILEPESLASFNQRSRDFVTTEDDPAPCFGEFGSKSDLAHDMTTPVVAARIADEDGTSVHCHTSFVKVSTTKSCSVSVRLG